MARIVSQAESNPPYGALKEQAPANGVKFDKGCSPPLATPAAMRRPAKRVWARAYVDVVKEHGAESTKDAEKFEELHRDRFYVLNGGESESANSQALRRGRQWLIGKGKLQIGEAGITLANAA